MNNNNNDADDSDDIILRTAQVQNTKNKIV